MTKLAAGCISVLLGVSATAGLYIDPFEDTGSYIGAVEQTILLAYTQLNIPPFGPDGPPPFQESDVRSGVDALGGVRELELGVSSDPLGTGITTASIGAQNSIASLSSASNVVAQMILRYGSYATGGSDLNVDMSPYDRFLLAIVGTTDVDAELVIDITSGLGGPVSYTEFIPDGTTGGLAVMFGDIPGFTGVGAPVNDVDGIQFTFRPAPGLSDFDISIKFLESTIPEPATVLVLGLGLLGLARRRRRRT